MGSLVEPIKIEHLRELQGALKAADGEAQKQIRVVFNAAAEIVLDDARRLVPTRSGKARSTMKALSGQREGKVVAGGKKAPYYPWLDFGGTIGRNKSVRRRVIPGGRYLYPSLTDNYSRILEEMAEGLAEAARNAGLEVT